MSSSAEIVPSHQWSSGAWESIGNGRYERVEVCYSCSCYRVATKASEGATTFAIVYYRAGWTGDNNAESRYRQRPGCVEPVNQDAP